jgi:hypothetical protein
MSSLLISRVPTLIEQIFVPGLNTHMLFTYLTNAGAAKFANLSNMVKLTNTGLMAKRLFWQSSQTR